MTLKKSEETLHEKSQKILRYLAWGSLVLGASITLGLLSFGGMFALVPILPLALVAFALSVAYEGEIYLQNVKKAWAKLFDDNYLQQQMANTYLLKHLLDNSDKHEDSHPFYAEYCELLITGNAEELAKAEQEFSEQLFSTEEPKNGSPIVSKTDRETAINDLAQRRKLFHGMKAFSALAALFMMLGTSYLLVEAFSIIPFLAAIPLAAAPFLIVPLSILAGIAYGFITYNSVTDMISNETLRKWKDQIMTGGFGLKNISLAVLSVVLVSLAIALTICTAGTWWTIAQKATPLFSWMSKIPRFVMGIINPVVIGSSMAVFTLENSWETMDLINKQFEEKKSLFERVQTIIKKGWDKLTTQENIGQQFNLFRILLKITLLPLQFILFVGHLISIGLTADRMPGLSEKTSALLGVVSEGFEDVHYFFGHEHGHELKDLLEERLDSSHSHSHDGNIPAKVLKFIFLPLYLLTALWDWGFSKLNTPDTNKPVLDFHKAFDKHWEEEEEHDHCHGHGSKNKFFDKKSSSGSTVETPAPSPQII